MNSEDIRFPSVAGSFYPSGREGLSKMVNDLLSQAKIEKLKEEIVGLIAPHAGYVYSGPTAAHAYKIISTEKIDTVVIIAQSHHTYLRKASIYPEGKFRTPLGDIEIDKTFTAELLKYKDVFEANKSPHIPEHSIEVQLPFLQTVLKDFKFVPILLSDFDLVYCKKIGETLAEVIEKSKKKIITVISTDLSHYPSYRDACKYDNEIIKAILTLNPEKIKKTADEIMKKNIKNLSCIMCAESAVLCGSYLFNNLGAEKAVMLNYSNSGDISGDKSRVVGYTAIAVVRTKKVEEKMEEFKISQKNCKFLLSLARNTIEEYLTSKKVPTVEVKDEELLTPAAVFVTLTKKNQLRGCIGTTVPEKPLYLAVQQFAISSAFNDPRFPPLTKDELNDIKIEISILSSLKRVKTADEIIPNIHGVVVRSGFHSGLYLPQVWEHFKRKEDFLSSLCYQKAGLKPDAWKDPKTELYVFTVFKFEEE